MAGYFQLFAEPYVMTHGDPLQSTVSVLYFMYEEGFKWWSLGRASAIAFLLFVLILVATTRAAARGAGAEEQPHESARRAGTPALVNGALIAAQRDSSLFPLLWMLSVSFMQPGEASTFPPPLLPAHRDARELSRAVRARRHGPLPAQQPRSSRRAITLLSLLFNLSAGYAFAKLRFAGRERLFQTLLAALRDSGAGRDDSAVPAHEVAASGQQLRRRDRARRWPSVFGIFLVRQYARSIPDELLEAARIDGAGEWRIFLRIVLPLLKPIVVTLAIFTFLASWNDFMWPLIVLSDQALADRAGRARRAVARARAGQRADDGRLGGHDPAGAGAVPRAAAALHRRACCWAA